jgi:hypothetical protein
MWQLQVCSSAKISAYFFFANFFIAFLALLQCLHAQGSYILVGLLLDYGEVSDKD